MKASNSFVHCSSDMISPWHGHCCFNNHLWTVLIHALLRDTCNAHRATCMLLNLLLHLVTSTSLRHYHYHHGVARPSKSMVVSTTLHQTERLAARRHAVWRPKLSGLRSASTVRSHDWRGRPLGRRQSLGRRLMEAHSARAWS